MNYYFDLLPLSLNGSIHGYWWLLRSHRIYSSLCVLRLEPHYP